MNIHSSKGGKVVIVNVRNENRFISAALCVCLIGGIIYYLKNNQRRKKVSGSAEPLQAGEEPVK